MSVPPNEVPGPADSPGLPVRLLHDRVLVRVGTGEGERRSTGGILIPATATMGRRLVWAEVVAVGPNARMIEPGDSVLFDAEEKPEVELHGSTYVMLRERDISAIAAARVSEGATGLYL
ncbi:GroES family chaperonin [Motilibacter deserti]|uniref:10 kDa chaperonin n=1 Tax=Motilibacter deserti TaxID=2714956 RepID=A0ABX0GT23_9ACTN|nr:co-chaperone GroES [Motilibacter deserti]